MKSIPLLIVIISILAIIRIDIVGILTALYVAQEDDTPSIPTDENMTVRFDGDIDKLELRVVEEHHGALIYDHETQEFRFEGGNVTESARLYLEELNRQSREAHIGKGPSPDFVTGFEKGVRYGILAYRENPDEDSLRVHTDNAKALYWMVEVNREAEEKKQ